MYIELEREFIGPEDGDEDDPTNWSVIRIPAKYVVCSHCNGKGRHVNPAIDGHGLTQSDFDELGEDFREGYFAGDYDITCTECHGERVTLVPDEDIASKEELEAYNRKLDDEYQYQQERRSEMIAEYGPEYNW